MDAIELIAHAVNVRQLKPEALMTFTEEDWKQLAYDALRLDHGMVRLNVVRELLK